MTDKRKLVYLLCCTFQELTEAAYAMYSEMVFVTLDIDEFAHWASRFVPKDYHAKHAFGKQLNFSLQVQKYQRASFMYCARFQFRTGTAILRVMKWRQAPLCVRILAQDSYRLLHKYPDIQKFSRYLKRFMEKIRSFFFFYLTLYFLLPYFLETLLSSIPEKKSSSAIFHSKNVFHITKRDKVAISKQRMVVHNIEVPKSSFLPQLLQQENFETCGLRDSKSVYSKH